jgi:hypothetical protein
MGTAANRKGNRRGRGGATKHPVLCGRGAVPRTCGSGQVSPLWSARGNLPVRAAVIGGPWMAREHRAPPRTAGEQGAGIIQGD